MSEKFTFTDNHKRNLIIVTVAGALLVCLGYLLSNIKGGHGEHGADEHATKTEHSQSHDGKGGIPKASANVDNEPHPDPQANANAHAIDGNTGGNTAPEVKPDDTTHVAGHDSIQDTSYVFKADAGQKVNADTPMVKLTLADSSEVWHLAWPARAYLWPGNIHHGGHGHVEVGAKHKFGGALLMAGWFFMGISVFGIFFLAFSYTANAGWFVAFKRVPEAFYTWLRLRARLSFWFSWYSETKSGSGNPCRSERTISSTRSAASSTTVSLLSM
jgi:hypothetical protein